MKQTMMSNDLGINSLVDSNRRVEINTFVRKIRHELKATLLTASVQSTGIKLDFVTSKTGFGGVRYWFKCPVCAKRVGTIFSTPNSHKLACRACLGLKYRKQRYKGMVENLSNGICN